MTEPKFKCGQHITVPPKICDSKHAKIVGVEEAAQVNFHASTTVSKLKAARNKTKGKFIYLLKSLGNPYYATEEELKEWNDPNPS